MSRRKFLQTQSGCKISGHTSLKNKSAVWEVQLMARQLQSSFLVAKLMSQAARKPCSRRSALVETSTRRVLFDGRAIRRFSINRQGGQLHDELQFCCAKRRMFRSCGTGHRRNGFGRCSTATFCVACGNAFYDRPVRRCCCGRRHSVPGSARRFSRPAN